MHFWLTILLLFCAADVSADSLKDPYPGTGGLFLGTPGDEDIQSGRSVYTSDRFAPLAVGVTSKQEVVDLLGKPANWSSNPDGTSELGYNFVSSQEMFGMREVLRASFTFDKDLILTRVDAPQAGE